MKHQLKIRSVALAAVAALGLFSSTASAGGLKIDINLGVPTPPPRHDIVVLEYDSYCVGYRHNLYDADWRLRNAQMEQWNAAGSLDVARHREGEIAVTVEDQEVFVAGFEKRVAESDAALAGARAAAGRAAEDAADARARVHAFEKRIAGAKDDLEAARTLHDGPAREDAEKRLAAAEAGITQAAADLHASETREADLQAAEAAAAALNESRARLADANAHLPRLRIELNTVHDEVFAAQQRLDAAVQGVALALHDRDEALWLIHRDEILAGSATFASCGFAIDLNVWGGHMPRDPEVVHAYFVHPVTFWVERPVEIQARVIEVDRVVEITKIRTIQEKHEGPRFREVVKFETAVPIERRRECAQRVVVERERLVVERTERTNAAAEHRAPRIPDSERAEARAIATKDHVEAKAEINKAHADARSERIEDKAEVNKAHADARSERIEDKAEVNKAHADAKSEKIGDKAEVNKAHADAKSEKIGDKAEVNQAKADARSEQIKAQADAKAEKTEAKADAKSKETEAKGDAKAKETEAKADRKTQQPANNSRPTAQGDSKNQQNQKNGQKPSEPTASRTSKDNKDPRNKPKDGTASVDSN